MKFEIHVYDKSEWTYSEEPFTVYVINKKTKELIVHNRCTVFDTNDGNKVLFSKISQPIFIVYKREID